MKLHNATAEFGHEDTAHYNKEKGHYSAQRRGALSQ